MSIEEQIERWNQVRSFALETGDINLYSLAIDWIEGLRNKNTKGNFS